MDGKALLAYITGTIDQGCCQTRYHPRLAPRTRRTQVPLKQPR
jgi:hypothetical protein